MQSHIIRRPVDRSPTSTEATFNQPQPVTIDLMRKVSIITQNRCALVLNAFHSDTQWVDSDKVLTLDFEKRSKRFKARLNLPYSYILIPLLTR